MGWQPSGASSNRLLILVPVAALISLGQLRETRAEEKGRGHGIIRMMASWAWPLACVNGIGLEECGAGEGCP